MLFRSNPSPEPITVRSGGSLTLDETIPVPERDSYIFEGWSYNDTLYNTWDTIENITSDIILMASWRAVPVKFSITFDGKEATGGTVPSTVNVDEGTSYTITSEIPEKTGYTFKGWSDGQNTYTVGETLTNISSDITLRYSSCSSLAIKAYIVIYLRYFFPDCT